MSKLVLFNKPFNTLCQFTGENGDSTLADYIDIPEVYPAGRLDKDSEGLLLLTDDGQLQNQIASPKHKMEKTYWVQVEGVPEDNELEPLRLGVIIQNYKTKPAKVRLLETPEVWPRNPPIRERKNIPTSWLEITISEGKNRQVRRMTAAVGFPTLRLIRAQIGQWQLDDLKVGEYKVIEVSTPKAMAGPRNKSTQSKRFSQRHK
ncbi:pseudouridine synthase [Kangiella koreensis]|uniref:Pseudouridine synthase n=1 Tax=Kangiella koreensis (strain DSM 16069 / JCM 12317 / KCTC 12182 / SW-125) TaxID=523791 RepID=C7RB76_KANKD|nr:pseudouridine synthase [Kangiella koreensis]ACV26518.1 pseudouridine synthase [Kangiella koreensis DSM 16069]